MGVKRKITRKASLKGGERRDFLVHLEPRVIKDLKLAALESVPELTASRILEKAIGDWLNRHKSRPGKDADREIEKRQFLANISVQLIEGIKHAASDRKVTASALVAEAAAEWLASNIRNHVDRRKR